VKREKEGQNLDHLKTEMFRSIRRLHRETGCYGEKGDQPNQTLYLSKENSASSDKLYGASERTENKDLKSKGADGVKKERDASACFGHRASWRQGKKETGRRDRTSASRRDRDQDGEKGGYLRVAPRVRAPGERKL